MGKRKLGDKIERSSPSLEHDSYSYRNKNGRRKEEVSD
jgi:hypothetical protein